MGSESSKRLSWEQLPDKDSVHSPVGAVPWRGGGALDRPRKVPQEERFKYQGGSAEH